jgi:hypothetical protein
MEREGNGKTALGRQMETIDPKEENPLRFAKEPKGLAVPIDL